jgi:hypothetical protein
MFIYFDSLVCFHSNLLVAANPVEHQPEGEAPKEIGM